MANTYYGYPIPNQSGFVPKDVGSALQLSGLPSADLLMPYEGTVAWFPRNALPKKYRLNSTRGDALIVQLNIDRSAYLSSNLQFGISLPDYFVIQNVDQAATRNAFNLLLGRLTSKQLSNLAKQHKIKGSEATIKSQLLAKAFSAPSAGKRVAIPVKTKSGETSIGIKIGSADQSRTVYLQLLDSDYRHLATGIYLKNYWPKLKNWNTPNPDLTRHPLAKSGAFGQQPTKITAYLKIDFLGRKSDHKIKRFAVPPGTIVRFRNAAGKSIVPDATVTQDGKVEMPNLDLKGKSFSIHLRMPSTQYQYLSLPVRNLDLSIFGGSDRQKFKITNFQGHAIGSKKEPFEINLPFSYYRFRLLQSLNGKLNRFKNHVIEGTVNGFSQNTVTFKTTTSGEGVATVHFLLPQLKTLSLKKVTAAGKTTNLSTLYGISGKAITDLSSYLFLRNRALLNRTKRPVVTLSLNKVQFYFRLTANTPKGLSAPLKNQPLLLLASSKQDFSSNVRLLGRATSDESGVVTGADALEKLGSTGGYFLSFMLPFEKMSTPKVFGIPFRENYFSHQAQGSLAPQIVNLYIDGNDYRNADQLKEMKVNLKFLHGKFSSRFQQGSKEMVPFIRHRVFLMEVQKSADKVLHEGQTDSDGRVVFAMLHRNLTKRKFYFRLETKDVIYGNKNLHLFKNMHTRSLTDLTAKRKGLFPASAKTKWEDPLHFQWKITSIYAQFQVWIPGTKSFAKAEKLAVDLVCRPTLKNGSLAPTETIQTAITATQPSGRANWFLVGVAQSKYHRGRLSFLQRTKGSQQLLQHTNIQFDFNTEQLNYRQFDGKVVDGTDLQYYDGRDLGSEKKPIVVDVGRRVYGLLQYTEKNAAHKKAPLPPGITYVIEEQINMSSKYRTIAQGKTELKKGANGHNVDCVLFAPTSIISMLRIRIPHEKNPKVHHTALQYVKMAYEDDDHSTNNMKPFLAHSRAAAVGPTTTITLADNAPVAKLDPNQACFADATFGSARTFAALKNVYEVNTWLQIMTQGKWTGPVKGGTAKVLPSAVWEKQDKGTGAHFSSDNNVISLSTSFPFKREYLSHEYGHMVQFMVHGLDGTTYGRYAASNVGQHALHKETNACTAFVEGFAIFIECIFFRPHVQNHAVDFRKNPKVKPIKGGKSIKLSASNTSHKNFGEKSEGAYVASHWEIFIKKVLADQQKKEVNYQIGYSQEVHPIYHSATRTSKYLSASYLKGSDVPKRWVKYFWNVFEAVGKLKDPKYGNQQKSPHVSDLKAIIIKIDPALWNELKPFYNKYQIGQ